MLVPFLRSLGKSKVDALLLSHGDYIAGVDEATAREALRLASHKLPIKTKFVIKEESGEKNEG